MSCLTPESVSEAFIANTPLIQSTIKNMTIQSPNWFRDLYSPMPWPDGEGTSMQQLTFRGELPQVEEGFDSWATIDDPSGCGPICAPNCSYNMSVMGGHSMASKITRLMSRDFRTPDYCVASIQNTRQYREVFSAIIANLYNQINFQKEINIGQNFLTGIAKKYVVDSEGFKPNNEDPYMYRPKGTATLSALNIGMLEFLYEVLRRMTDVVPYDFQNNSPLYAMVASPQLISRLYRDDPSLRADYRAAAASGGEYADNLVKRYNFTNTIRDMFFPVSYLWPRRFRYDAVASKWIRVLPWVKGVPGTVGTFTGQNPHYEDPSYATHEEVLFHGRDPFSVFYQPMVRTIGEGTDFGPEPGFWDVFQWVNPQTRDDPARREGFFFTTARIALSADNSEGVFGVLVPRPPTSTMIAFYPSGPCPPEAAECTNVVPEVGCPTPMIESLIPHPTTAGHYFLTLAAPVDAAAGEGENPGDTIQLGHSSGGYVNSVVVGASTDQKVFEVTISGTLPDCDRWVSVYTGDSLGCKANVVSYAINASDATRVDLILDRPIKADTNADVVSLVYGNGTTIAGTVVGTPSMLTNAWTIDIGGSAFADNVGGIVEICVPTATDSSCAACETALISTAQCVDDR